LDEVPVVIKNVDDLTAAEMTMVENLQREELNPIEEATGYQELIDSYDMTQEQLAKIVGKARSSVTNALRLLTLPGEVLELVRGNKLSRGHCKAIMSAASAKCMIELAKRAANGEITVRDTERLAKESREPHGEKAEQQSNPQVHYYKEAALALSRSLSTKVRITDNGKKKVLCIEFADEEQLKGIMSKF
jgi:ParB family chromosome partitioning protein